MVLRSTKSGFTTVPQEDSTNYRDFSTGNTRNPQAMSPQVVVQQVNRKSLSDSNKGTRSSTKNRPNTRSRSEDQPNKRKRSSTQNSANFSDDEDESSDSEVDSEEDPAYGVEKAPNTSRKNTRKTSSADNTKWKKEADELKKHVKVLKNQNAALGKRIKSVAAESILNARKGSKEIWDSTKIATEFKTLGKDIKNWAKQYAISKKFSSFTDDEQETIMSDETLFPYTDILPGGDLFTIEELPTGAKLLLEGFLYSFACSFLISRPFIFIDGGLKDHGSKAKRELLDKGRHENSFEKFASQLENVDEYQSQKWRASMLQSLKQVIIPDFSFDGSKAQRDDQKRSNDFLKKYDTEITALVNLFLKGPAEPLLEYQIDKKQQREELKKIFRKFRELAYHMYCQPSTIACQYERQGEYDSSTGMLVFNPDTMELDTSATHGRQDTETKRLAGDKVLISLNPTIFGVNIDADNGERRTITYLKQKVWTADCQTYGQWQKALKEQEKNAVPSNQSNHIIAPEKAIEAIADHYQTLGATVGHKKNHDAALPNTMERSPGDESKTVPKDATECRPNKRQNDCLAATANEIDEPEDKMALDNELEYHPNDEQNDNSVEDNESICSDAMYLMQMAAEKYDQAGDTVVKEEVGASASKGGFYLGDRD